MPEPKRFQIERDRFGLMCSRDLAIGEMVEVVEAGPLEAEIERLKAALTKANITGNPVA